MLGEGKDFFKMNNTKMFNEIGIYLLPCFLKAVTSNAYLNKCQM